MLSALSVAEFCLKEAVRLVCSSLLLASVLWRSPRSRDFSLMGRVCPPRRGTTRPPDPPPPLPAPPSPVLSDRRLPLTPPAGFFGKGGGSFLSSWPENIHVDSENGQWVKWNPRRDDTGEWQPKRAQWIIEMDIAKEKYPKTLTTGKTGHEMRKGWTKSDKEREENQWLVCYQEYMIRK